MKFFILFFALTISLLCFWYGSKFITLYLKIKKSWTVTKASVLSKKAELHKQTSTAKAQYAVRVEYQYAYQNQSYQNNTVYLVELLNGQANHMESNAQKIVANIPNPVSIYVNPENPKESVIFCEGIGLYVFIVAMGFVSLLMGIAYYK